ncbi:MAG: segregation/condensation protein A [Oscillospiraceae bacterium]|jgi:segregation and condensation protein A|nr:segregation/condensation protein A [Oscillospiraceae bacterium]
MEKISYKIEVFEGPMDLLLHLISKHKLNIMDIPIFELVEQYTDYVRSMRESNMEVSSEFLDMAARLVHIKTVSLLPVHEEADILKSELAGELLEYRDCQIMAGKLLSMANGFDLIPRAPQPFERDYSYSCLHEPDEIFNAYKSAVGKGQRKLPPPAESFTGIVSRKIISVTLKIKLILKKMVKGRAQNIGSLYQEAKTRSDLVATFLAVLELVKTKRITLKGKGDEMCIELSYRDRSFEGK